MVWPFLPAAPQRIPDLCGRVYLITGGNVGVGYETAKALLMHNAHVILAARDPQRAEKAVQDLRRVAGAGQGKVESLQCDLTSFRSIADLAAEVKSRRLALHCLLNNAGTENPPDIKTPAGFDPTMATNYFGTFYLTHLLLDSLASAAPARMVVTGSLVENHGRLFWDDLAGKRAERSDYRQYCQSKLALLMFVGELQRRLGGRQAGIDCFAAHPGVAQTDAFRKSDKSKANAVVLATASRFIGQSAQRGAQSLIRCATEPELQGSGGIQQHYGSYYFMLPYRVLGPAGGIVTNLGNQGSRPPQSGFVRDAAACARLYEESLRLCNEGAAAEGAPRISAAQPVAERQLARA